MDALACSRPLRAQLGRIEVVVLIFRICWVLPDGEVRLFVLHGDESASSAGRAVPRAKRSLNPSTSAVSFSLR